MLHHVQFGGSSATSYMAKCLGSVRRCAWLGPLSSAGVQANTAATWTITRSISRCVAISRVSTGPFPPGSSKVPSGSSKVP